jgi:predicted porin
MKKQLIAAAVAGAFALPAMAQVTISGSISMGVVDSGVAGAKPVVVERLGGGSNALNLTTSEDLGGGMSSGAQFQIRFDANGQHGGTSSDLGPTAATRTTTNSTTLFHGANVFLASSSMGRIELGKIIEDNNCAYDPWGCTGGAGSTAGLGGTNSALVFALSQDRSIRYTSPVINGFRVSYQSTVQSAPAGSAERSLINLTYSAGPLSAQYMMGEQSNKTEESGLGLSYNLGFMTAMGGTAVTKTLAGAKTRDMTYIGATVPLRPGLTGLASWSKDSSKASNTDSKWGVGVNYALSKRTTVGADVFEQEAANRSTGFVLRARHTF